MLWEKFDQYQPGTEFRAWACRIAHFKALKFCKDRKRAPRTFSEVFFDAVDEEVVVMADRLDARYMQFIVRCGVYTTCSTAA